MYFAKKEDGKIVGYVQSSQQPKGYVPVTLQEIDEFEQSLLPVFVTITIPLQVFQGSPDLQAKLQEMALIFSDIKRRPDANGNLVLSNINLDDVRKFLSDDEYKNLSQVGVVFDPKIQEIYEPDTSPDNPTSDA